MFKKIMLALWAILVVLFISNSFFTVSPWERKFIVRFGEIQDTVYWEGLYYKTPFLDNTVKMNIKNVKIEAQSSSSSKDLQDVVTIVALNYAILPTSVQVLYANVGKQYSIERVLINPAIQESVKAATAVYTAEELITERPKVTAMIIDNLKNKLENRGISVVDVNIINFEFSKQFNLAIEAKVEAEQKALTAQNKLKQVEFEAQQSIEKAKAEAEKIRIQAKAVTSQGGAEYVRLQWIAKRDGKLPVTTLWSNMDILMQMK